MGVVDDRLAEQSRGTFGVAILIEGVGTAFTSLPGFDCQAIADSSPTFGTVTTRAAVIDWSESGSTLDLHARRMVGGSFGFRILDEPSNGYPLRSLFNAQQRPVGLVATAATATATSIVLDRADLLPAAGHAWVNGEAVFYTSITGSTLNTCVRGRYGTRPSPQFVGAEVYAAPPSWIGRRVRVFAVYATRQREGGGGATHEWQQLGTWRLEAAPRYDGEHVWTLDSSTLADELAQRKAVMGFEEQSVNVDSSQNFYDYTTERWTLYTDHDLVLPAAPPSVGGGIVLLMRGKWGDRDYTAIVDFVSWENATWALTIKANDAYSAEVRGWASSIVGNAAIAWDTIQLGVMVSLSGGCGALLTSRNGNLANGVQDFLPGADGATEIDGRYRTGFGIAAAEVGTSSFRTVGSPSFLAAFSEVEFSSWAQQWCTVNNRIWYIAASGRVETPPLSVDAASSVATISAAQVMSGTSPSVTYDEEGIAPFVKMATNWNPIEEEHTVSLSMTDHSLRRRYSPRETTIAVELGQLYVDAAPRGRGFGVYPPRTITVDEARQLARRLQGSSAKGFTILSVVVDIGTGFLSSLGSLVDIELPWVPDYAGGTMTGKQGRVLSRKLDFEGGRADLQLQILEKLFAVAPSAIITSQTEATLTLSIDADHEGINGTLATPGRSFAPGWLVHVWDVSTATAYLREVVSVTDTTITLNADVPIAIDAGIDYITLEDHVGPTTTPASAEGYRVEDFIFCVPASLFPDGDATRWR